MPDNPDHIQRREQPGSRDDVRNGLFVRSGVVASEPRDVQRRATSIRRYVLLALLATVVAWWLDGGPGAVEQFIADNLLTIALIVLVLLIPGVGAILLGIAKLALGILLLGSMRAGRAEGSETGQLFRVEGASVTAAEFVGPGGAVELGDDVELWGYPTLRAFRALRLTNHTTQASMLSSRTVSAFASLALLVYLAWLVVGVAQ